MTLQFGTDGVRGLANVELTPELALALGRAAARVLGNGEWVVGRDTRHSGPLLHAALGAGLAAEGATVIDLGVLPTPGVAHDSVRRGVPAAMISASHNPFADNGIKFFAPGGHKLSDEVEGRLEVELQALAAPTAATASPPPVPQGAAVGTFRSDPDALDRYVSHLISDTLSGRRLAGLRVVVDTANGAASEVAPRVLRALGAEVTVLHAAPNGTNINDGCGSTHPGELQRAVPQRRAQLGLAFDGDADRVLAVDADGNLVDGDQLIALCALDLRERGMLADDTVVVTVMTNLGFRLAMERHGVKVVQTAVGDRHVLAALDENGWSLGGEQSGHLIFRDLSTTGDGVLAGLQVLDVMARTGRSLADLAGVVVRLPQVLRNVRVANRRPEIASELADEVADAERRLGHSGRVLLRASGTEPLVRVMVEAPTSEEAAAVADRLVADVERVCAGST